MRVLLDTCAILWSILEPEALSKEATQLLRSPNTAVSVSAMSCAEIACGVERKRIELNKHWKLWFREYVGRNEWTVLPIDLSVIEEAYSLPGTFHADPSDRILVATARLERMSVVTGDRKILDYPHVESVW